MSRILVVGEDVLCCALGERLVAELLPGWALARSPIDTKGVTKLTGALRRYDQQAQYVQPVLCIADTDGRCAAQLIRQWLPAGASTRLLLRLAVTEAESWILADRAQFADFFAIDARHLPEAPDTNTDPKRLILRLAGKSKKRVIRQEVVSETDPSKPGSGYNLHLSQFVRTHWRATRAMDHSRSLKRAVERIQALPTIR